MTLTPTPTMTMTLNEPLLTTGNTAKLYCLNWIAARAQAGPLTILDLGCGDARNFEALLRRYPAVQYVGIEPSAAACEQARRRLAGLPATIVEGYAYAAIRERLPRPAYDVVVSFSVFEHVYRRLAYLQLIRACLGPGGHALINYDCGHFRSTYWKERLKNIVGPLLARLGQEGYYQAFVREADFRQMVAQAGLHIVEAQSFNTPLKGVYKHIPEAQRAAYMQRWLALEAWLNESAGIVYDDSLAGTWFSRNFILRAESG
ncbi:MAG: class I SAM-dependent methyltransferase [Anaerolineae bacterium]|nr:class I SAM-dependent methyltransferase [Anaerolineae bacterium]